MSASNTDSLSVISFLASEQKKRDWQQVAVHLSLADISSQTGGIEQAIKTLSATDIARCVDC